MTRIVVNGRFLGARPTGLQRVGRALLDEARGAGLDAEVVAPPGVDDPRVDRVLPAPPGRVGAHAWEQLVLPAYAGRRTVLSLANTAPVAAHDGVVMVHDLATAVGPQWFRPEMRLYGELSLRAARRARLVLTVSHAVAAELRAHGVRRPLAVIQPAVDRRWVPADPDEVTALREQVGLARPYVVLLGWRDPRKDAATVLGAHLRALRSVPHDLVLVSGGSNVFAPVAVPDLPTVVRLDAVDDVQLRVLLTGAAALLYPSRYEGFGLPPLEAAACGTPAVVSDLPVLRESTAGHAAFAPPGDVGAWTDALVAALHGQLPRPPRPTRTPADAGRDLVSALGC